MKKMASEIALCPVLWKYRSKKKKKIAAANRASSPLPQIALYIAIGKPTLGID
jgi:hypothetical protein